MTPKDRERLEHDLRVLLEKLRLLKIELETLNGAIEPLPTPPVNKKLN